MPCYGAYINPKYVRSRASYNSDNGYIWAHEDDGDSCPDQRPRGCDSPSYNALLLCNTGCMLKPKSALWRPSWNGMKPAVARLWHVNTSKAWYVTLLDSMCFSKIFHCHVWCSAARLSLAGPLRLYNPRIFTAYLSHTALGDEFTSNFQQSFCSSHVEFTGPSTLPATDLSHTSCKLCCHSYKYSPSPSSRISITSISIYISLPQVRLFLPP